MAVLCQKYNVAFARKGNLLVITSKLHHDVSLKGVAVEAA